MNKNITNITIEEHAIYLCGVAESVKSEEAQVIDGLAEVEVSGIVYQVQLLLEPREAKWVVEDKPTI